jgi:hypothetical protein
MLPRVLSGERPLPAATVAGDLLKRRGIGCLFLCHDDAATVTDGGATALEVTLASGTVALHTDVRTGEAIIRAADLRAAGVLIEPPADSRVWHDEACRVGAPTEQYDRYGYLNCTEDEDEGGGAGSIHQSGRGRRVWHSRSCEFAEQRRARAGTVRYQTCAWSGCTLDDGNGPGSIAARDSRLRVVHDNDDCRRGARSQKRPEAP